MQCAYRHAKKVPKFMAKEQWERKKVVQKEGMREERRIESNPPIGGGGRIEGGSPKRPLNTKQCAIASLCTVS